MQFFKLLFFSMWFTLFGIMVNPINSSAQVIMSAVELNLPDVESQLRGIQPGEEKVIKLPNHEGRFREFTATESNIMSVDFREKRPDLRSFRVVDRANPEIRGRLALSKYGIHAFIRTPFGTILIEWKDGLGSDEYYIYLSHNPLVEESEQDIEPGRCLGVEKAPEYRESIRRFNFRSNDILEHGDEIMTYNLAIVTTGDFYLNNGGTTSMAETVVMASVNAIQAIYEVDVAVHFNLLVPHIYTNPATHPFPGNNLPKEAADAVNTNFTIAEYDMGHVFHNSTNAAIGGGGVAGLGVVCKNLFWQGGPGRWKAAGWSGSSSNTNNPWIQLAAHEFGHMFDATHTFNGDGASCGTAAFEGETNYEIGSGSTIMSYQGLCSSDQNIPPSGVADNYFHANSIERMINYILDDGTCSTDSITGNTPPEAEADPCGNTNKIPISTPFKIVGEAFDSDGDVLSYIWEQYDNDGQGVFTITSQVE